MWRACDWGSAQACLHQGHSGLADSVADTPEDCPPRGLHEESEEPVRMVQSTGARMTHVYVNLSVRCPPRLQPDARDAGCSSPTTVGNPHSAAITVLPTSQAFALGTELAALSVWVTALHGRLL